MSLSIKDLFLEWKKNLPSKDEEFYFVIYSNETNETVFDFSGKLGYYKVQIFECFKDESMSVEIEEVYNIYFQIVNEDRTYTISTINLMISNDYKKIYTSKILVESNVEYYSRILYSSPNTNFLFEDNKYDLFIIPVDVQEKAILKMKNGAVVNTEEEI